jgi:hypothetical protein
MQFITLYHVASSLRRLRSKRATDLTQQSLDYIDEILSDTILRDITSDSSRHLRNTFIHYGLHSDVQDSDLNPYILCYGLIEKYLPGHDYASLSKVVTEQVGRVTKVFNEWV